MVGRQSDEKKLIEPVMLLIELSGYIHLVFCLLSAYLILNINLNLVIYFSTYLSSFSVYPPIFKFRCYNLSINSLVHFIFYK